MFDPTEKCLAAGLNDFRMAFLRLDHGGDETSDESVPAERRADFRAQVEYHLAFAEQWFERACNSFGASDGTWATVPEERQADALRFFGRKNAEFENACEFELDLLRIEQAEALDAKLDECLSVGCE